MQAANILTRTSSVEIITRRHALQPSSLNAEARTVEIVMSAFADVQRSYGVERLPSDPAAWEIPADGVPLLDGHRTGSFRDILGRVRNIRIEGGQMLGTAHISNDDAWAAVERGDLSGVSIGYVASKFSDSRSSGRPIRSLAGIKLLEASLLPIPADPGATIRSNPMEEDEIEGAPEVTSQEPTTRGEINTHIRSFERRGVSRSFIDTLIDEEPTLADANARILGEISNRPAISIGRSNEDPTIVRGFQAEALAATYSGAEPSEGARAYMGLSMHDHMRLCLTRSGERNVSALGTEALITRSMGTTSDFPITLDDAGNRIVLSAYQAAESPLKRIAVQRNIPDFRDMTAIRTGGLPTLKKVNEAGEIKHETISENGEKFRLDTYASIFGLTRQVLINDRFGVLGDFARNAGIAAANTERELLLAVLLEGNGAGPLMSDGVRLFHATHGNLGTAGAPDVAELSAARLAMRLQTGIDGETRISVTPKFLLVAADLETTGEQLLASLAATTVGEQNPFAGKLTLLVEPGLEEGSWYVAADPAQVPTLAYGYLSSAPGPQLASREGWNVLGREWRVVLDFGAGVLDWRGIFRNPGEDI